MQYRMGFLKIINITQSVNIIVSEDNSVRG
jgi:hypothetical protein